MLRTLLAPAPTQPGRGLCWADVRGTLIAATTAAMGVLVASGLVDQWISAGGAQLANVLPPSLALLVVFAATNLVH